MLLVLNEGIGIIQSMTIDKVEAFVDCELEDTIKY